VPNVNFFIFKRQYLPFKVLFLPFEDLKKNVLTHHSCQIH